MTGTVLLVEDSEIIALDTEDMLYSLGFDMVTHVRTCEEAFAALEQRGRFDCAVLDINLAEETSFPVARHLLGQGVPFVFATGYSARGLDADFADTVVVPKPYSEDVLGRTLGAVLAAARERRPLVV